MTMDEQPLLRERSSAGIAPIPRSQMAGVTAIHLAPDELAELESVVVACRAQYLSASQPEFLDRAADIARRLPARLRESLARFRGSETAAALLIQGIAVDDRALPPTPLHWRDASGPQSAALRREEYILMLVAAYFGEPYGYATLQGGHLFHHLLPIPGQEDDQSGHSSAVELDWHSEDAFTPARCDFLALMSLRNHERIGTLFAPIDVLATLSPADRRVLAEPRFVVHADEEHLKNVGGLQPGMPSIHESTATGALVPILHGGGDLPYMVIDKAFMAPRDGDDEAERVFAKAMAAIDRSIEPVPMGPGDILIVDNHRAVHGRAPFTARYDGTDRWLIKVSITRDLMKSRPYRQNATSRVVH
ncbi:MAG TPA: guanitoxin biosynthesis L-enduracididine beta-hydroxylase GntD [Candidatus Dormibacteraeota bacterium]|nr:guanitoxin biosynthesis L-enduracididine beta-hydroxylase GntD [Candidatus Dormibacteraeota bacterium]